MDSSQEDNAMAETVEIYDVVQDLIKEVEIQESREISVKETMIGVLDRVVEQDNVLKKSQDIQNQVRETLDDIIAHVEIKEAVTDTLNNVTTTVEEESLDAEKEYTTPATEVPRENTEKVTNVSSSDDSLPLAYIKNKRKRPRRRKKQKKNNSSSLDFASSDDEPLIAKILYSDISDDDPPFIPSKEDVDSSDSNTELVEDKVTPPKKRKDMISLAIEMSKQQQKQIRDDLKVHLARIDNLMTSNSLQRIPIAADGNCFFEAVSLHLSRPSLTIREEVCDFLENEFANYIQFIQCGPEDDENTTYLKYFHGVSTLRQSGIWDTEIGDIVPLALSNMINRKITIYSSSLSQPVFEVDPVTVDCHTPVTLALVKAKNVPQHYDACVSKASSSRRETNEHVSSHIPECASSSVISSIEADSLLTETDSSLNTPRTETSPSPKENIQHSTPKSKSSSCKLPTPRKTAVFVTPPKKQLFRKRSSKSELWKRNMNKTLKLSGKQYISSKSIARKGKSVQTVDCSRCKFKCCSHITDENRQTIFEGFYALDTYERQKDFICANTTQKTTITILGEDMQPVSKKRQCARSYSFVVNGERLQVCKKFFRKTLNVGVSYIEHALKNSTHGSFHGRENRGRHTPVNKTPDAAKNDVRRHIASFPAVDPHYTRKDSNRKYLDQSLTVQKMYLLYLEDCKCKDRKPVSKGLYRRVFTEEYNFSFHKPKKDQCLLCSRYHQDQTSESLQNEYKEHQDRKTQARKEKENDKKEAQKSPKWNVSTFDLQAVLTTPCSLASPIFYKRKLNTYNLSVYSLGDSKGYNYIWDETEGRRGLCEISTCLNMYLSSLPPSVDTVTFFSDTCSGQNRNQFTSIALLHAVSTSLYLTEVNQTYLESGHSQMECDSMHAAIEHAKKRTTVHVPSQWDTVIQMARQKNPYKVVPLKHSNFLNYKAFSKSKFKIPKSDTMGKRVNWLELKWIQYRKSHPDSIFFKQDFSSEEFRQIRMLPAGRRGRPTVTHQEVPQLYHSKLPVTEAKKRDLLDLCKTGVIPDCHHDFYENLPTAPGVSDHLPVPDEEEEDQDTDA